jgi:4a-hydroxytetrahydrobiopterin dehydratase
LAKQFLQVFCLQQLTEMMAGRRQAAVCCVMAKIADAEALKRLQNLTGWERDGDAIRRKLTFGGFPQAVAFVVRLGFVAEAADHHPDILLSYKRVTLTYSTHSEGGLTVKDFDGATAASALAAEMGGQ